ncbi:MAG: trypsin-like serine protease [Proteobacteria bacterium]|jgi:MYXO-CTERM domain-containing protein|nr:trypsin-like serine protease [Pseudomonadota bacterium]
MRTRWIFVSFLLAAGVSAACDEGTLETYTPVRQHGIVNGETEEGFPSTVALGADFGGPTAMCTGNLLTPRVIISAAHCGDGIPIEMIQSLGVAFFGTYVASADAAIGFDNLVIHPDYVELDNTIGELGQFDLSIFVLKEDAPVEPTWFNRVAITDEDIEAELKSVGFGITGPDNDDSGTKRSATLLLAEYDDNFLISKNFYNPNNANICSGDSGGPQFFFRDGFWVEGAVHSWGDQYCAVESGSTRVDIATEWILDQIEDVHGSRDVCEINGWYDDGVCHPFCDEADPDCVPDAGPEDDGGVTADAGADAGDDSGLTGGCGCSISQRSSSGLLSALLFSLIAGLILVRRRRRR